MKLTVSEQLHRDKVNLAQRMADYDEGCIVAGRSIGLSKNRASHVFNKIKEEMGKSQCQ